MTLQLIAPGPHAGRSAFSLWVSMPDCSILLGHGSTLNYTCWQCAEYSCLVPWPFTIACRGGARQYRGGSVVAGYRGLQ